MHKPRVSVVIPTYNRAETVAPAVQSVLDQSLKDIDVIAVDDGSSDETVAVLKAMQDPRLRVLTLTVNQGVSAARNHGIAAADSHWVAFQDSDDIWHPEKLERQMARLEGSDHVAVYCGMDVDGAQGSTYVPARTLRHRDGDVLPSLVHKSFISTQTVIVRRDILQALGGFDEHLSALVDWELMLRVAQTGRIALVDMPLVRQTFSANSITRDRQRRVAARAHIVEKHGALIDRFPGALAQQHYALAGGYRICGDFGRATDHMAKARQRAPWRPRWWIADAWLRLNRRLGKRRP